jgi:hypothetical protein
MKPQKIKLLSDGTYANTKLYIGNREVYFESINIVGSQDSDLDIAIGLSSSKISRKEIKDALDKPPMGFTHAEGHEIPNEFDEYEEED